MKIVFTFALLFSFQLLGQVETDGKSKVKQQPATPQTNGSGEEGPKNVSTANRITGGYQSNQKLSLETQNFTPEKMSDTRARSNFNDAVKQKALSDYLFEKEVASGKYDRSDEKKVRAKRALESLAALQDLNKVMDQEKSEGNQNAKPAAPEQKQQAKTTEIPALETPKSNESEFQFQLAQEAQAKKEQEKIDPQLKAQITEKLEIPQIQKQDSTVALQNSGASTVDRVTMLNKQGNPNENNFPASAPTVSSDSVHPVNLSVYSSIPKASGEPATTQVDALDLGLLVAALKAGKILSKTELNPKVSAALDKLARSPKPTDPNTAAVWEKLQKTKDDPMAFDKVVSSICDSLWEKKQFEGLDGILPSVLPSAQLAEKFKDSKVASLKKDRLPASTQEPEDAFDMPFGFRLGFAAALVIGLYWLTVPRRKKQPQQGAQVVQAELLEPKRNLPVKKK